MLAAPYSIGCIGNEDNISRVKSERKRRCRLQGRVSGERTIRVAKESEVEERKCPECGSGNMRRSQMRGFWERGVLRTIGVRAYRCEKCDHRYNEFRLGKDK